MEDERRYVTGAEQDQVSRALLLWLDQYPDKPVGKLEFEYVPPRGVGMSLMTVTGAYKTEEYISGAYEAQYQFAILYRAQPTSSPDRLAAAGALTALADWAEGQAVLPDLGPGRRATSVERNSPAVMIDRNDDQSEDYQILMTLNYEVRP